MVDRILRRPEVEARTGISRSTIYAWMKEGTFPLPVKMGTRLVGWMEADIQAWVDAQKSKAQ
jgi:prophage regulatory protein|tara:strand:- start:2771 stop:2956 length:186 start_codon:yes stop_codon:yes gene_type:complete